MPDNSPDDPKAIWQSQPTETSTMTLERIRQKTRELQSKARRQRLGSLSVPLCATLFYVFSVYSFSPLRSVPQLLFLVAVGWSLAGLYVLNRGKWRQGMPDDAGLRAGIEFCRQEIERRRQYSRRVLFWGFAPVLLAISTFVLVLALVAGKALFPKGMPFITLVLVWIAAYFFVVRVREQRELQREIENLETISRENGQ